MNRFHRSLALARASWSVLKSDKSLTHFPILQFVVSLVVVAALALVTYLTIGESTNTVDGTGYTPSVMTFVVGILGYIGLAYIQTYFLAGLVVSAHARLHGQPTSVGAGLKVANARAGRLLPWAVVSGTIGWILQSIEQRAGILGRIVVGFLGAAWSVLTFLAVPVIVFEDVGPITALKRSGSLLKQTWGENVIGQVGLGLIGVLPVLAAFGIGALGVMTDVLVVQIAAVLVAVAIIIVTSVVMSALSGIYRAALYSYAIDGTVPGAFAGVGIETAFAPKQNGF